MLTPIHRMGPCAGQPRPMEQPRGGHLRGARELVGIAALTALYVVAARLGLMFDAVGGFASVVWPPTGIALSALVLFGFGCWPAIAVGAFLVNLLTGAPPLVALGIAVGNTLEAVLGAHLLRRSEDFEPSAGRVRDVIALILGAAVLSTLVSAAIGVSSLCAGKVISNAQAGKTFVAWWLGDLVGDLVVAPVLLVWGSAFVAPKKRTSLPRVTTSVLERLLLIVLLSLASLFVFARPATGDIAHPLAEGVYLFFPLLTWTTLRLGQRAAYSTTFAISAIAVTFTAMGCGPFVRVGLYPSLFALQTFIAVMAATFLVLGAFVAERCQALHDIEASHEARAALVAQLEEVVRSRDALISIASHELRTPLSTLRVQLRSLERAVLDSSDRREAERFESRLARPNRQVARLGKLIDDLLDVSRINAGRLQLERETVDLTLVVRETVERLDEDLRSSGSAVTLEVDGPVFGLWDPMRLDQIVTNLVSNAAKYGRGKPIEIAVHRGARSARLEVRDQGVGIDEKDHARIFEQFERLVPERATGGLGLGLWIVRRIVEALGGTIQVESRLGFGSTFVVDLPLERPAAAREPAESATEEGASERGDQPVPHASQ